MGYGPADNSTLVGAHILSPRCALIRDAAYMNREGATYLVQGDLNSAVDRLFAALNTLVLAGGLLPSPEIDTAYRARSFPFEKEQPSKLQSHLRAPLPSSSSDCDDGSFFVYSNPFIFHPIMVDAPEYSTNCAAVVLFNLGLALHQRGRRADSRALYRARSLYDMSLTLVSTMSCQAACANLNVAATNNKAHVQFEVAEVFDAKNTLHALLSILGEKSSPPPFPENEVERFYMNVLHVNGSTLAAAA